MSENNTSPIECEETNHCPKGVHVLYNVENSAVNAVVIVTGKKWSELIYSLVEQAHIRGNMPWHKTCITDMMRANGFKPVSSGSSLTQAIEKFNDDFSPEKKYIVKLNAGYYYAIIPDVDKKKYGIKGLFVKSCLKDIWSIEKMWLYIPGSDNRTGIVRRVKEAEMDEENEYFFPKNVNPYRKSAKDCAIRAFAAAYDCTWHEAVDHIAKAISYQDMVLNSQTYVNNTLIGLGFEYHRSEKIGDRFPTGKELCDLFKSTCRDGERIYIHYRKPVHDAAIIPIEENGTVCYKVQDTWDSSAFEVRDYLVYKPLI